MIRSGRWGVWLGKQNMSPRPHGIMKLVVGMTGSTGAVYGIRALEVLREMGVETHLVISRWAAKCVAMETGHDAGYAESLASRVYGEHDMAAGISSGTFQTDGMLVIPCSMKTLAGIACGYDDNLISRAAGVTIKESRRLVLAAREAPLSAIHLENMLKLARLDVVIVPPMTEFYTMPKTVGDIVDHGVGKCLDQFGLTGHGLYRRWGGGGGS